MTERSEYLKRPRPGDKAKIKKYLKSLEAYETKQALRKGLTDMVDAGKMKVKNEDRGEVVEHLASLLSALRKRIRK